MIRVARKEGGIRPDRFTVIPPPDDEFHKVWVAHLLSQTPSFDLVFTNEPLTFRLLKESGLRVERIPMFNRKNFTSTEVRRRLLDTRPWRKLVPKSVPTSLPKIHGAHRLPYISKPHTT